MNLSVKKYINEFLIVNLFLLDVSFAAISSYIMPSFFIKLAGSILLYGALFLIFKPPVFISFLEASKLPKKFLVFIFLISLTLIYSLNREFGIFKLSYLLVSTIPCIAAFYYLAGTNNPVRTKAFLISVILLGLLFAFAIIIIKPFNFNAPYSLAAFRWSHQIYGRIASIFFLTLFFTLIKSKNRKLKLLLTCTLILIFYSLFLAGGRSVIIGICLVSLFTIAIRLYKRELDKETISFVTILLFTSMLLIYFFPPHMQVLTRYENLSGVEEARFGGDPQIHERFIAYDIAIKRIGENPVLGLGLGGFKSYYNSNLPLWMMYPHNIFLEYTVEMGMPGLLLLLYILYLIFSNSFKISYEMGMFFVFALWLALFSKDISTQILLYTGIVFTEIKKAPYLIKEHDQDSII